MPIYQIAGIVLDSPIELPNLAQSLASADLQPDLIIEITNIPILSTLEPLRPFAGGRIQWLKQGFRLIYPRVGEMVILANKVYWQPQAPQDIKGFRTFLVNTLLPAYAVLRGMLPLHISAVSVAGHAIAFQGKSGAGKSTLAALLMKRGFSVITEDLGIIELGKEQAIMRTGLPYFRLWKNSFKHLNETPSQQNMAWLHKGKFYRTIEGDELCSQPQPIRAIYFLQEPEQGDEIRIETISGFSAANALLKSRFFGVTQHCETQTKRIFDETMTLANQTRCFNLIRPKNFAQVEQVIDTLIAHWKTF
jgi:hypothetical protein